MSIPSSQGHESTRAPDLTRSTTFRLNETNKKSPSITKFVVGILMLCSLIAIASGITGLAPLRSLSHLSQAAKIGAQAVCGFSGTVALLAALYLTKKCLPKKPVENKDKQNQRPPAQVVEADQVSDDGASRVRRVSSGDELEQQDQGSRLEGAARHEDSFDGASGEDDIHYDDQAAGRRLYPQLYEQQDAQQADSDRADRPAQWQPLHPLDNSHVSFHPRGRRKDIGLSRGVPQDGQQDQSQDLGARQGERAKHQEPMKRSSSKQQKPKRESASNRSCWQSFHSKASHQHQQGSTVSH